MKLLFLFSILKVIVGISNDFDEKYLWGTYKPQLIHAISQRDKISENPILISMIIYNPLYKLEKDFYFYRVFDRPNDSYKFDYEIHNGYDFAIHRSNINDLNLNLTNTFIKLSSSPNNHEFITVAENWGGHIDAGLIFNFAIESFDIKFYDPRSLELNEDDLGWLITIKSNGLFGYENQYIRVYSEINGTFTKPLGFKFNFVDNPKENNYEIKETVYKDIIKNIDSNNFIESCMAYDPSLIYLNFVPNKYDNFRIFIHYNSKTIPMPIKNYDKIKTLKIENFHKKLKEIYFNKTNTTDNQISLARSSFTNLIGGLQYSYGNILCVQIENNCNTYLGMLSHTPSRFGFPRPFLWDEGFHLLVVKKWYPEMALNIISDWLDTMNNDGWIPREQARGYELRSFITWLKEDNREANPPTFIIILESFLDEKYHLFSVFLSKNWEKIKLWYVWWYKLQGVYDEKHNHLNMFNWWGPIPSENVGSGMDDYPRNKIGFISYANIDACSWAYIFTQSMIKFSNYIGDYEYSLELSKRLEEIKKNINVYLKDKDHIYKDLLISDNKLEYTLSDHLGYINLLPLAFGIIENQESLNSTLTLMRNPNLLWTNYGIRSLSKTNEWYGKDYNYWRGPIWININYLVLRGLKKFYWDNAKSQEIYTELRNNLINNIYDEWESRGYLFEHYNQNNDKKGSGYRPFNGWTSLVTLIISEEYN